MAKAGREAERAPFPQRLKSGSGAHLLRISVHLVKITLTYLQEYGIAYTAAKAKRWAGRILLRGGRRSYAAWMKKHRPDEAELAAQRARRFPRTVLFSVVVPLCNTPEPFLREMIGSVTAQTYPHWELCLADGSDGEHGDVGRICREYGERDARIRYRRLEKDRGISGNTNAALEMAAGEYAAFLDPGDLLAPSALFRMAEALNKDEADVLYTDEARFLSPSLEKILHIHFKPDFAIDTLRANNYICHFTACRRSLLETVGGCRSEYDGSQDHDLMLRLAAVTDRFVHIPEPLYFWRVDPQAAADPDRIRRAVDAGRRAVQDSLDASRITARVESVREDTAIYRIRYELTEQPKVSIIIPTCDRLYYLKRCLESIEEKTTYRNYEVLLVENNSRQEETFAYYREAERRWSNVRVIHWPGGWNWSAINNFGVRAADGKYLVLLNNDTEIITPDWIEEMLMFAQRADVGAVGAMLYYPNKRIQHAGLVLGLGGYIAGHIFRNSFHGEPGYSGRLLYAQDLCAVSGACMMVSWRVWEQTEGLDERLAVCGNDVDLCMQIRRAGYLVVWTPFAELIHYESRSRGYDDTREKQKRMEQERTVFLSKWQRELEAGDLYYNPNLSLKHADFRPEV